MTEEQAQSQAQLIKSNYKYITVKLERTRHRKSPCTLILEHRRENLMMRVGLLRDMPSILNLWDELE